MTHIHYSDVTMRAIRLKSPAYRLFAQSFVQAQAQVTERPPHIRSVTRKTSIWWPHHANIYVLQSPFCLPCAGVSIQHLKVMTDCIDRVCAQFKTPLASWFKDDGRIPFGSICHQRYIKLPCIRLKCLFLSHRYSTKIVMRFPCNI